MQEVCSMVMVEDGDKNDVHFEKLKIIYTDSKRTIFLNAFK